MEDTTKSNVNRDTREINRETTGRDQKDTNPDPITGAPGSHPVGTGVGAAVGGTVAGLAGGAVAGVASGAALGAALTGPAAPIGAVVGAVIGAVAGGYAGKGVAEGIDPTAEDAYWKEQHKTRDYAKGGAGKDYTYDNDYKPAYQYGWESTGKHAGKSFDQAEPDLAKGWESARGGSKLSWDNAKHATRDAWDRLNSGGGERRTLQADAHETVPVIKENLQVGKEQVQTGGVRVTSEVHERPVEAQVKLREEHVDVARRAVDRPVAAGDATAFREGTIEMTEKAEQAVVSKQARVVEEVMIGKEASERTETVRDNVRQTLVDVEPVAGTSSTSAPTGGAHQPFETYGTQFRSHWQQRFATSPDERYELHEPAYRYGYNLATDERYRDVTDWSKVEPSARSSWETHNPGSWDRFKDSVRHSWDKVRGR